MEVIKRDGRKEPFNVEKIVNAVKKAYDASDVKLSKEVEDKLRNLFTVGDLIDIEEIQDKVEEVLMQDNPMLAKSFIIYRYKHQEARIIEERIKYMNAYVNSGNNASSASETDSNANVVIG